MSMNRDERRALKKKIAPTARRIAYLENQISQGIDKEQNEAEISSIIDSLTILEMLALEDYVMSKGLLNNFDIKDNKNKK